MDRPNMDRLSADEQRVLVRELVAVVKRFTPEWTNQQDTDPGVTLLELFAWLTDILFFREKALSDRERVLLTPLLNKLTALLQDCNASGLIRPRYFTGELLTADDFQAEQDYVRAKMRLHNRCLVGSGIVTGLNVTVDSNSAANDEPVVTVTPGCAIDSHGEQLVVCDQLRCTLSVRGQIAYAILRYSEQMIDPVPTLSGAQEPSRIQEGVTVEFEGEVLKEGVAIARLKRVADKWVVDPQFQPARIKVDK